MIQLRENGNLYRAGCGKHFIGVKKIFLPGWEIKDSYTEDTVKIAVHPAYGSFQLLPQNLLFLLGRFFLGNLLPASQRWDTDGNANQPTTEKTFQQGNLRVSAL